MGTAPRPIRASLCLLAACGLAVAAGSVRPAAAASRTDALQAGPAGGELTAVTTAGGLRIERAGEPAVTIDLAEGAVAGAISHLAGGGWAVAGSRPDGDGGRELFFARGQGRRARPLAAPGGRRGSVRSDPVLFADGGRLAGAAWLEGEPGAPLGVRAAAFDGRRWGAPEPVAPPGPGSQLALAGAVLDDGSWLLVWSAFDGGDDEIAWARRLGGSWLPAARMTADNAVPDVAPALAATPGGGALAAWSRFDGAEYRLRLARFDGDGWRDLGWAAPGGSVFPSFAGDPARPWLLYRDAGARGWAVAEVDPEAADAGGAVRALGVVPAAPAARPALAVGDGGPVLVWPAAAEARELRRRLRAPAAGSEDGR